MRKLLLGVGCILLITCPVRGGEPPAYMQLKAGTTAEIKLKRDKGDLFWAEDVELLPEARRPKIRGAIQAVDTVRHAIRVLSQWIVVGSDTQFLDQKEIPIRFSDLRRDARVEVGCRIDTTGEWYARHLRTEGVKSSDKIKGTVSRVMFDGTPPDTIEINGLRIVVTAETAVFRTLGGTAEAADSSNREKD